MSRAADAPSLSWVASLHSGRIGSPSVGGTRRQATLVDRFLGRYPLPDPLARAPATAAAPQGRAGSCAVGATRAATLGGGQLPFPGPLALAVVFVVAELIQDGRNFS